MRTHCPSSYGGIDNVNSVAKPSLYDNEVVKGPVSDHWQLKVRKTDWLHCIGLYEQAIGSRRRRNRLRGDAVPADTTCLATVGDARFSAMMVQNHCQAGGAAVQHAELKEHRYTAAARSGKNSADNTPRSANHKLPLPAHGKPAGETRNGEQRQQ
jgi:hypothetical protein